MLYKLLFLIIIIATMHGPSADAYDIIIVEDSGSELWVNTTVNTRVSIYSYASGTWYKYIVSQTTLFMLNNSAKYLVVIEPPDGYVASRTPLIIQPGTNSTIVTIEKISTGINTTMPFTSILHSLNTMTFGWGLFLLHVMTLAVLYVIQGPLVAGAGSLMLTTIFALLMKQLGFTTPLLSLVMALATSAIAVGLALASGTRD